MKNTLLALTVGAVLLASQTYAADKNGDFAIRGVGRISCEELLDALEKKDERLQFFGTWLDGYLTATNQLAISTFDATPWQTTELLLALLGRACAQNTEGDFMSVVGRLVAQMRPLRLDQKSKILRLPGYESAQLHYVETVERVRRRLVELGYSFDNPTVSNEQAYRELQTHIRDFQSQNNLPSTGNLDQHTLLSLFVLPKPEQ